VSIGTLDRPQSSIPTRTRRREIQDAQISRVPFHIEKTASVHVRHLLAKLEVAGRGRSGRHRASGPYAPQIGDEWLWAAWR
jgi:hypothetical protein